MAQGDVTPEQSRRELYAQTPQERRGVGIISISHPIRGRYYTQAEASAFARRRLLKHLPRFGSYTEFVEFAIEVAKDRRIPAPNRQKRANDSGLDDWDVDRIERILISLMRGGNSRTKTLQFFNTACDELEGIRFFRIQDEETAPSCKPLSEGEEEPEPDEPLGVVLTPSEPLLEEGWREELVRRYVNVLIDRVERADELDESLLDRIERVIGV